MALNKTFNHIHIILVIIVIIEYNLIKYLYYDGFGTDIAIAYFYGTVLYIIVFFFLLSLILKKMKILDYYKYTVILNILICIYYTYVFLIFLSNSTM